MSKPWIHAVSSAKKWGGVPEDYVELHDFMDSSKGAFPDNRHRALTHNSWFISPGGPLERCFGHNIVNSDGRSVSVRDLGEQHILEDFGNRYIPSVQDWLESMEFRAWMNNGAGVPPPSNATVNKTTRIREEVKWGEGMID